MGEIARTEIDGIPTFWVDRPGPMTAYLAFRVGMADESLPTLGISHMVEHLALFPQSNASCSFNGRTEDTRTIFYATGSPEEIRDFLNGVTAALNNLPLERMDTERRILFTEAHGRGGGLITEMLSLRFGPTGHGLPAYPEHGLRGISAEQVSAWTGQRFTRGNAALAFTGRPPEGLNLRLHNGRRYPTPQARPIPAPYPTVTPGFGGAVAVSLLAKRSSALISLVRIIQRRAMQHLRTELGVSYSVDTGYQRLDDDVAHLTLAADALPDQSENVLAGLLHVLESLAKTGPTVEELERDYEEAQKAYSTDDAVLGELAAAARYELFGEDPKTQQDLLRELQDVTPDQQATILDEALNTSLWLVPPGSRRPEWRFRPFLDWSPTRVHASAKLKHRNGSGPKDEVLHLAGEGISLTRAEKAITVRFSDCAGMLCWDSGDRVLYGADGFVLDLTPAEWRDGERILQLVDRSVDTSRRIPMGESRPPGERNRSQLGEPDEAGRSGPFKRLLRRKKA